VFYAAVTAVLLNVILSCVLVIYFRGTYMAFISPALATVVSVFVSALYQLVMAGRVSGVSMRMAFPWKTLGGLMACAVICAAGVVPVLLIFDSGLLRIVPGALAYILCYALAISKAADPFLSACKGPQICREQIRYAFGRVSRKFRPEKTAARFRWQNLHVESVIPGGYPLSLVENRASRRKPPMRGRFRTLPPQADRHRRNSRLLRD
jgi:hypothetical protein